jgi:hypothetical protein
VDWLSWDFPCIQPVTHRRSALRICSMCKSRCSSCKERGDKLASLDQIQPEAVRRRGIIPFMYQRAQDEQTGRFLET